MKKIVGMSEATYKRINKYLHTLVLDMEQGIILNRDIKKVDDWGYYRVSLAGKAHRVHQVFAVARWGEACIGMTVNHINENKVDNNSKNLDLLTNEKNASLNKGGRTGKTVRAINIETGEEFIFESTLFACRTLRLSATSVRRVLDKIYPQIKGYAFERITA